MQFWFLLLVVLSLPEPGEPTALTWHGQLTRQPDPAHLTLGTDGIIRTVGEFATDEELDFRESQSDEEIPTTHELSGRPDSLVQSAGPAEGNTSPQELVVRRFSRRIHIRSILQRRATLSREESGHDLWLSTRLTVTPLKGLTVAARWDDCASGPAIAGKVVSGFAQVSSRKPSMGIFLGDFVVEAGQGLLFWGPEIFRGGTAGGSSPRRPRGVFPVVASSGTRSLRGLGLNALGIVGGAALLGSLFASERILTASPSGPDGIGAMTPLVPGAVESARAVRERLVGMSLRLQLGKTFTGGLTAFTALYSEPLSRRWLALPGRTQLAGVSVDMGLSVEGLEVAGEWAFCAEGGGNGFLAGTWALHNDIVGEFQCRTRVRGIGSRYASHPGLSPEGSDEVGFGVSLWFFPRRLLTGSLSLDHSTVGLSDNGPAGSQTRLIASAGATVPDFGRLLLQVRATATDELAVLSLPGIVPRSAVDCRSQAWIRAALEVTPGHRILCRTRFDATLVRRRLDNSNESGECLAQELRWLPAPPLAVEGTILLYGTVSYDSRLYWMEGGPPRSPGMIPMFGRGERWSLAVRYAVSRYLRSAVRIAGAKREEGTLGATWRDSQRGLDIAVQLEIVL